MANVPEQFSWYEVKESTVKFAGATAAEKLGCVGALEVTMNTKTVTKKCEGVVAKSVTYGTGDGEIKYTVHMMLSAFRQAYGFTNAGLKSGVYAYGSPSKHVEFCYTAKVKNEEGDVLYVAYPKCCVSSARVMSVENGAEEVAEIEVTAAVMPYTTSTEGMEAVNGFGEFTALESELDASLKETWLKNFTPETCVADKV